MMADDQHFDAPRPLLVEEMIGETGEIRAPHRAFKRWKVPRIPCGFRHGCHDKVTDK